MGSREVVILLSFSFFLPAPIVYQSPTPQSGGGFCTQETVYARLSLELQAVRMLSHLISSYLLRSKWRQSSFSTPTSLPPLPELRIPPKFSVPSPLLTPSPSFVFMFLLLKRPSHVTRVLYQEDCPLLLGSLTTLSNIRPSTTPHAKPKISLCPRW